MTEGDIGYRRQQGHNQGAHDDGLPRPVDNHCYSRFITINDVD